MVHLPEYIDKYTKNEIHSFIFFVVVVGILFLVIWLLLLSILFLSPWKESFHKYVFHLAFPDRPLIVQPVHILMWKTLCRFPHLRLNCSFHESCMEDGTALCESNGFWEKLQAYVTRLSHGHRETGGHTWQSHHSPLRSHRKIWTLLATFGIIGALVHGKRGLLSFQIPDSAHCTRTQSNWHHSHRQNAQFLFSTGLQPK